MALKCYNCDKPIRFWQKAYWVDDDNAIHTKCLSSKFGYRQAKHITDLAAKLEGWDNVRN